MYHYIITAIVALAAVKVEAQAKDNLISSKRSEKSEAKRGVANEWADQVKKESHFFKSGI